MKYIHFPTIILHILILLLARLTINDYPGFFLCCADVLLLFHFVWAIVSKKTFVIPNGIALGLYVLAESLGIVVINNGFFGMGGGFAWFFYGIALLVSFAAHCILWTIRRIRAR